MKKRGTSLPRSARRAIDSGETDLYFLRRVFIVGCQFTSRGGLGALAGAGFGEVVAVEALAEQGLDEKSLLFLAF